MKFINIKLTSITFLMMLFGLGSCDEPTDYDILNSYQSGSTSLAFDIDPSIYDVYNLETSTVNFTIDLGEKGEEATAIEVFKQLGSGERLSVGTYSSFPAEVSISASEAVEGTGKTLDQLKVGDQFIFTFDITQADGFVTTSNTVVPITISCGSALAGTYDVVTTWTDYYGIPGTNSFVEEITPTDIGGQYEISDLTGGMEPIVWGNAPVKATISDVCLDISLVSAPYIYTYTIESGEVDEEDGTITIVWKNQYGENGVSVYTPQ